MKEKQDFKKRKKCPRCGSKMHINAEKCTGCGLIFERIQNLSNEQAKIEIKEKRFDNVLNVFSMPKDVNKKKFWLLFAFTGWFGGHNIYLGKYKRGYYALITGILALLGFLLSEIFWFQGWNGAMIEYYVTSPLFLFFAFAIIIWFSDLFNLIFKQFRYPASLTLEDYEKVITKKIRGK